jgi:hypothetical protein
MKTRSIMREIGFYRNLNDPSVLKNNFNECKAKKNEVKTHKKVFALEYKFLRIEINSQMIRLLKFSGGSKYSSPNVTIKIHISEKLYRHFKDKFVAKYKSFLILSDDLHLVYRGCLRIFFVNKDVLKAIKLN